MISSNADLYARIRALGNELKREGQPSWSASLIAALSISTVTGEVLGETRLQLQKLQASEVAGQLGLRAQIDEALSYLNQVLNPR